MYENLKHLRKENKISGGEMANVIGLKTASAYLKKENGESKFSLEEGFIIAKFFNKPTEDIFNQEDILL